MAYRYEGGIDLSGALGTIATGMERAALMKKQQDQLAESKVDDFLKMYQPGKLRTNDLPDFINAYNQFKQSALNYSRLNRSGKDASLISAADVQRQKALGELNQVYAKSSTLADKQAEYAEYLKAARTKGYEVPSEVSGIINTLTSSKLSDLDLNNIPSAYSFDLMPKEIDLAKIGEGLDRTQAKIKEVTSKDEQFVWGQDINGKPIMATKTTKYLGRDPRSTVDFLSIMSRTNPKINNQAKEDYSLFRTSFEQNSPAAQERLNEIKEYFPTVKTIDDVTPEMNYGLMFYRKQPQAPIINDRAAKQEYDLAVDKARIAQGQQRLNIQLGDKKDDKEDEMITEVDTLLSSPQQPTGAPVSRLSLMSQQKLVGIAEKSLNNTKVNSENLYMRKDPSTGVGVLYAAVDIKDQNNKVIKRANERIGPISKPKPQGTNQPTKGKKLVYKGLDNKGNAVFEYE
jgi:hypothetical protein